MHHHLSGTSVVAAKLKTEISLAINIAGCIFNFAVIPEVRDHLIKDLFFVEETIYTHFIKD